MEYKHTTGIRLTELAAGRFYMIERAQIKILKQLGVQIPPMTLSNAKVCYSCRILNRRLYITGEVEGLKTA